VLGKYFAGLNGKLKRVHHDIRKNRVHFLLAAKELSVRKVRTKKITKIINSQAYAKNYFVRPE